MKNPEINEIFAGMEEVYKKEEARIAKVAPSCHFMPMNYETSDDEAWWECSYCGHTKDIN